MANKARDGYLPRQREASCPERGAGDDSRVEDWYCLRPESSFCFYVRLREG